MFKKVLVGLDLSHAEKPLLGCVSATDCAAAFLAPRRVRHRRRRRSSLVF
jgi:hypothetical protein